VSHRPEVLASRPSPLFLSYTSLGRQAEIGTGVSRAEPTGSAKPDTTSTRLSSHHSLRLTRRVLVGHFSTNSSTYFCNEQLTNSRGSFLYDAEIVAGSPLKFEKHLQEFFLREQTPCKNDDHSSQCKTASSSTREHSMGAVRHRNPKKGSSIRAAAYVRISAQEPLSSPSKQKAAIHRYAKTQKLHIALVYSDQHRAKHS
jgi:hypothetical protein